MAGAQFRKLWDKLLSPFKQVENRALQHEIDVHRLFLLTSFNKLGPEGHARVEEIQAKASASSFESQRAQVQNNVHHQISAMAEILDAILLKTQRERVQGDELPRRRSGLSLAVGGAQLEPRAEDETWPLTRSEVSSRFLDRLGFTLECKPSTIRHEAAGDGLFIRGKADPGTVVAMYPGVIYTPSQYRHMPNYPRVDKENPYLISRYDGVILDGMPWGRGADARIWWDGTDDPQSEGLGAGLGSREGKDLWEVVAKSKYEPDQEPVISRAIIERRNPLAFGHFANHPSRGSKPNVLICPFSATSSPGDGAIRPYVPNLVQAAEDRPMARSGLLWMRQWERSERDDDVVVMRRRARDAAVIRTVVLVAARELEDEELLLNYRLSSHVKPPAWFHPVDEAEDRRRWE